MICLGFSRQDSQGAAGDGPVQAIRMLRDLDHLSEELGLVSLEGRLKGDLTNTYKYLQGVRGWCQTPFGDAQKQDKEP